MVRVRTFLVPLGMLCAAASLYAQGPSITITSLQAQAATNGVPTGLALPTAAITTGTPNAASSGFFLVINGANFVSEYGYFSYVQWTDPVAGTTYQIGGSSDLAAYVYSVSASQIVVFIPSAFYSAPVGSPDPVQIQVVEYQPGNEEFPYVASNTATFALNPPLSLPSSGAVLPPGFLYGAYSQPFFSGGTPPYTPISLVLGGLPPGLPVPTYSQLLAGIPTALGNYSFSLRVTDEWGNTITLPESLSIIPPPPPPLLFVTTSPLPGAVVGTAYSTVFQVTGGVPGYQFSCTGGSLPGGLALYSDGVLAGTPTAYGQFSFTVQVTDSTGTSTSLGFILNVRPAPLVITTGTLPAWPVGTPISITFAASGGAPPYSFSATGSFPGGAHFSGAGVLTAPAPTSVGSYTFLVSVADTQGNSTSKSFILTITAAPLVITTTSPLANATVGIAYSASFAATGGIVPYTWTATGTPPGLSLSSAGILSGTPTAFGAYTLSVTVTDSSRISATGSFALTVSPAALVITTTSLPNGTVGVAYSAGFSATGGVTPYTWSLSGLPPGLSGSSSGAISGTPTAVAAATVAATVTDARGTKASTSLTLSVTAPPLVITTTSLPAGAVGTAYSAGVAATGGIPPYTWSASGAPAGVGLSGTSFSGTPTAAGSFQVAVTVKDSLGTTASASFPVTITLPSVSTVTLTGPSGATGPASQPPIQIGISSSFPVPITVNLTLTFTPVSGADDPSVQFSTGGRTAQETIAAGSTLALPALAIQTGTVAGTITITAQLLAGTQDITPTPAPSISIVIASLAPVITKVSASSTTGGFTISVVGYSTTRQVTQAVLQFTPASGTTLSSATFTIPTTSLFTTWYGSAAAAPYGSQFTFTQPFTVSGSAPAVTSVSVTLSNSQGNSNTVTAPVP
ncbi:MAG: beta strand repeat-containing protein [Bryobacteraceae bacterium]